MGLYADTAKNFYKYFVPLGLKFLLKTKKINPTGFLKPVGFRYKGVYCFLQTFGIGIVGFTILSSIGAAYYISPRWDSMLIPLKISFENWCHPERSRRLALYKGLRLRSALQFNYSFSVVVSLDFSSELLECSSLKVSYHFSIEG